MKVVSIPDHDASAPDFAGRRPVIGVAGMREPVSFGIWTMAADFMPTAYTEAIQLAGGRALVLPLDARDIDYAHEILHGLDGLILPGGNDLHPAHYGHDPHPALGPTMALLDEVQLALTRAAIAADLPLLGVCRGMQVLNVASGGTLHQHLPAILEGSEEHRRIPGTLGPENEHDVHVEPGSVAAEAIGSHRTTTRSHHHQAVDQVGEGLIVTGRAVDDGLIEAIESTTNSFCLGVQWHPEADPDATVIAALVDAARRRIATYSA